MRFTTFPAVIFTAQLVSAATHLITVGGDTLTFTPSYVSAVAGDVVRFEFHVKNHTATQSSFSTPCSPLAGGFNTGFQPVSADLTSNFPYNDFQVSNTAPAWFYCQQGTHCSGSGMVFAVNPGVAPATNTFEAFKAIAMGGAPPSTGSAAGGGYPTATAYPTDYPSVTATVSWASSVYTTTYASFPGSPDPTPAPQPETHTIVVGGSAGLVYQPSNIAAKVGDIITFQFKQKNHTISQSSFNNPCRKLEFTSNQIGFDSGFFPVADGATNFPTYSVRVNDTAPIWAYCRQTSHCGSGMVFSANAVESGPNNFAAFQNKAKALNGTTTPSGAASSLAVSSFGLFGALLSGVVLF